MNTPSVDELLQAIRKALASLDGLHEFHRLGARQEAVVHARIGRRRAALGRDAGQPAPFTGP